MDRNGNAEDKKKEKTMKNTIDDNRHVPYDGYCNVFSKLKSKKEFCG